MLRWPSMPHRNPTPLEPPPRPDDDASVRWIAWRDVGPFRVWHKAYRSDFQQTRHAHATGSVDFNLAGGGWGTYLGRERNSLAGAVEYYRADGDHTFRTGPGGIRVLHMIFREDEAAPSDTRLAPTDRERFDPDEGAAAGVAARLLGELHRDDASSGLSMESLCHELLGLMRRWPTPPAIGPGAVARVVEMLRAAPEAPVSLTALASAVDLNAAHLARAFRAAMGVSPGEYHRRLRVARAAKCLATSDEPIAGMAGDLGFADQAHMTRWFSRIAGVSPAAFRRLLRA